MEKGYKGRNRANYVAFVICICQSQVSGLHLTERLLDSPQYLRIGLSGA